MFLCLSQGKTSPLTPIRTDTVQTESEQVNTKQKKYSAQFLVAPIAQSPTNHMCQTQTTFLKAQLNIK